MERLVDLTESAVSFKFEEASGEVDGQHIIGKISGPFFVPGGVSRNNRKYPRELWEKVCNNPNTRSRLIEKRMFGTIGHKQKLDDEALLEGKMALITTNLQVQNDQGLGEALILGTPAGKILNTVLRAGCKLYVSSRADGSFKGEDKGIPIVDPDTYHLEGFDVVLDPGFLQANPSLVEKFDQILAESTANPINEGDLEMDTKLLESIAKDNATLKAELERATTEIETLKAAKTSLVSENGFLKGKLDKQNKNESIVKKFEYLGSPEQLEKVLDLSEAKLNKWATLGSFNLVSSALEKAEKRIKEQTRLIAEYREIGSPKEVNDALDKSLKIVAEYKEQGKPSEIAKSFDMMEQFLAKNHQEKSASRISELAKELKVSEEKIKTVYGKLNETEIKKIFGGSTSTSSNPARTFVKRSSESSPYRSSQPTQDNKLNLMQKSLGARLLETFSPPTGNNT